MKPKQITKLFFVALVALFATFGSGIVAEQIGWPLTPAVYACGNTGGGGC